MNQISISHSILKWSSAGVCLLSERVLKNNVITDDPFFGSTSCRLKVERAKRRLMCLCIIRPKHNQI